MAREEWDAKLMSLVYAAISAALSHESTVRSGHPPATCAVAWKEAVAARAAIESHIKARI